MGEFKLHKTVYVRNDGYTTITFINYTTITLVNYKTKQKLWETVNTEHIYNSIQCMTSMTNLHKHVFQ